MKTGETISHIRRSKNISVKSLCGDKISRSAYNRFINGETDPSISTFLFFFERLNVSYKEFMFIKNNGHLSEKNKWMLQFQNCISSSDVEGLDKIRNEAKVEDIYCSAHIVSICNIYINFFKKETLPDDDLNSIKKYLMNTYSWTNYEVVLFNLMIPFYTIDFIELVLPRTIAYVDKYKVLTPYESGVIRVLFNVMNIFLQKKEYKKAQNLYLKLSSMEIEEGLALEKIYMMYYEGIIEIIVYHKNEGIKKINNAINICDLLDMKVVKKGLISYMSQILPTSSTYNYVN